MAIKHSVDLSFKDFMNLCEKCIANPYSFFLVNDTPLTSDNPLRFRFNLFRKKSKLSMAFDDKSKDKKLKYDISREAAKISALSSGRIDKYEYFTGKKYYLPIKVK